MDIKQEIHESEVSITTIEKRIQIQSRHPISSVRIVNVLGQTIFLNNDILTDFFEYDLRNQENGLYIIIVNNRDAQKVLIF